MGACDDNERPDASRAPDAQPHRRDSPPRHCCPTCKLLAVVVRWSHTTTTPKGVNMRMRIMDYISYHGENVLLVIVVAGLCGSCIANLLSK